jgi:hypothetical protein
MLKMLPLVLVVGCGIVSGPSPADPRCARLDDQNAAWTTVATVGGVLGTTAGTMIPLVDKYVDPSDSDDWNLGLGITTAIGGGLSLIGGLMSSTITQLWTDAGCGGSSP